MKKFWPFIKDLSSENNLFLHELITVVPASLTAIAWLSPAICYLLLHLKVGGQLSFWNSNAPTQSVFDISNLDPLLFFSTMTGLVAGTVSSGYALKALHFCKRKNLNVSHKSIITVFATLYFFIGISLSAGLLGWLFLIKNRLI
jgi:hypothetical protein